MHSQNVFRIQPLPYSPEFATQAACTVCWWVTVDRLARKSTWPQSRAHTQPAATCSSEKVSGSLCVCALSVSETAATATGRPTIVRRTCRNLQLSELRVFGSAWFPALGSACSLCISQASGLAWRPGHPGQGGPRPSRPPPPTLLYFQTMPNFTHNSGPYGVISNSNGGKTRNPNLKSTKSCPMFLPSHISLLPTVHIDP